MRSTSSKACFRSFACSLDLYPQISFVPVVVINEADLLTRDAQAALRRTMEKYMSNLRIILCANSTSRLIAPIKSRCLLVRVAAPSIEEVRCSCYLSRYKTKVDLAISPRRKLCWRPSRKEKVSIYLQTPPKK
jgi:DNA polymerase III, delta subunit